MTGRQIATPTQYAKRGDDLVILVARPDKKTWWRNFTSDADLDVLVKGTWLPMTGRAVVGTDDLEQAQALLEVYLDRFPRVARSLGERENGSRAERAVLVLCRPR